MLVDQKKTLLIMTCGNNKGNYIKHFFNFIKNKLYLFTTAKNYGVGDNLSSINKRITDLDSTPVTLSRKAIKK